MTAKHVLGDGTFGLFHEMQMRRVVVAAALLLVYRLFAVPVTADVYVDTLEELKNNISSGDVTIIITDNISVDRNAVIPAITSEMNITLTSQGNHKIYRTGENTTTDTGMFTVDGGNISGNTACEEARVSFYNSGTFTMNRTTTVDANNDGYLADTTKIEVPGAMTSGDTWNITPTTKTVGTVVVSVSSGAVTAANVQWYFKLNPSLGLNLRADGNYLIIAKLPEVNAGTVKIIPYNSAVTNVTFNLTADKGETEVYVNLTNATGTTISKLTGGISAGMGVVNHQLTGLTPGQSYQPNITPWNITAGTLYTYNSLYTAPLPEIAFENATTRIEIREEPLYIANGTLVVIRANITYASKELTNETVSWSFQGGGFQKLAENTTNQ